MPTPTEETFQLPIAASKRDSRCAAQHFGAWAIKADWFASAMSAVRNGTMKPRADYDDDEDEDGDCGPLYQLRNGVAVIAIDGQMTKKGSSFGGCSTVAVRQALRAAGSDWSVKSIVLSICTPGGTVAGTSDLADDVAAVRAGKFGKPKSVYAAISDMCCSAGYWVASQCEYIYANKTALVGNIGTYTVLEDDTGMLEQMGVKFRVISSGPYKGLGADGTTPDALVTDTQREIDELNAPFLAAVQAGRAATIPDMATVADGRAYVAEQAKNLGLIDEIASLDAAIMAVTQRSNPMTPTEQVKAIAAEHPEAVASFIEQGKKAGVADGAKQAKDDLKANVDAAKGDYELAVKSILAGHDAEAVKLAVEAKAKAEADAKAQADAHAAALAEKDKEIERLKFEANGRKPIGTQAGEPSTPVADASNPKAAAEAEWEANADNCHDRFVSKDVYVRARVRNLNAA